MNLSPQNNDRLEELVHRTLRDIPSHRAPRSLERSVLAEIQRRAALPWWRRSFAHWPVAARASFVVLCAVVINFVLSGGVWTLAGLDSAELSTVLAQRFSWIETALIVARAITSSVEIMLRNIPSLWLYGGLAFFAAMYAAFFGLGAAAYKAIHAQR
jgi:hypothetical protein